MAARTVIPSTLAPQQAMAISGASPTCKANVSFAALRPAASAFGRQTQLVTRPESRCSKHSSWGVRLPNQSQAPGECAWGVDQRRGPRTGRSARVQRAVAEHPAQPDIASFNEILAGSDIIIGTALNDKTFVNFLEWKDGRPTPVFKDDGRRTFLLDNFSLFVSENAMKPDHTQPTPANNQPKFVWNDEATALSKLARDNKRQLKGHTLAWHAQIQHDLKNPNLTPEQRKTVILEHVKAVAKIMGREGCTSIDVVNECIDSNALRPFWTTELGHRDESGAVEFFVKIFNAAHEGAPNARLCINDYGTTIVNDKSTALFNLCRKIKEAGGHLDEVGFQTHEACRDITTEWLGKMRANMARFEEIGMTSNISELDLYTDDLIGDDKSWTNDEAATRVAQAAAPFWYNFFRAALEKRSVCTSVTIWNFDTMESFHLTRTDGFARNTVRFPCLPWRTKAGKLEETAIVGSIRRALRDSLQPSYAWQPFGCQVGTGFLTQNRSGGTFSGPQSYLPPKTDCSLNTSVVCSGNVWLTLKSSEEDGKNWEFKRLSAEDQRLSGGAVSFRTTGKKFNVVYLEGPSPEVDFVVGPTFLNGQPMAWEPNFPANGTLRSTTFASAREASFAGLMITPPPDRTWKLTTKVYSRQALKLTLKSWDVSKGQFKFEPLARADSAGVISAEFYVPAAAPDGTKAFAYIESDQGGDEDYAADAPKLTAA